jgi:hypothetical protein
MSSTSSKYTIPNQIILAIQRRNDLFTTLGLDGAELLLHFNRGENIFINRCEKYLITSIKNILRFNMIFMYITEALQDFTFVNITVDYQESADALQKMIYIHHKAYDRVLTLFLLCLSKSTKIDSCILLEKYQFEINNDEETIRYLAKNAYEKQHANDI